MVSDILLVGIMLTIAIVFAMIIFAAVFWKVGEKISREKQLYLDCMSSYKKPLPELTPEELVECKKFVDEKLLYTHSLRS